MRESIRKTGGKYNVHEVFLSFGPDLMTYNILRNETSGEPSFSVSD